MFVDLVADAQRRRHERATPRRPGSAPSPASSSGSSTTSTESDKILYTELLPLVSQPAAGCMSRPAGPSSCHWSARTSSTPSTSRSSCSSATSSRGGPTSSTSRSTTPTPARRSAANAPSCAGSATAIMLFDVKALTPQDFDTWLARQGRQAAAATPAPAPERRRGRRGETDPTITVRPGRRIPAGHVDAKANAAFQIDFENQDAGTPHNVDDPQGFADRRGTLQGRDLLGRRQEDLRRAGPAGRDLRVRLYRSSER